MSDCQKITLDDDSLHTSFRLRGCGQIGLERRAAFASSSRARHPNTAATFAKWDTLSIADLHIERRLVDVASIGKQLVEVCFTSPEVQLVAYFRHETSCLPATTNSVLAVMWTIIGCANRFEF